MALIRISSVQSILLRSKDPSSTESGKIYFGFVLFYKVWLYLTNV